MGRLASTPRAAYLTRHPCATLHKGAVRLGGGRGAKPLECEGQAECESVGVGLASDEGEGEAGAEAGIVSAELRSVGEWVVVLRDGEQERSGRVERIVMQRDAWWMDARRRAGRFTTR